MRFCVIQQDKQGFRVHHCCVLLLLYDDVLEHAQSIETITFCEMQKYKRGSEPWNSNIQMLVFNWYRWWPLMQRSWKPDPQWPGALASHKKKKLTNRNDPTPQDFWRNIFLEQKNALRVDSKYIDKFHIRQCWNTGDCSLVHLQPLEPHNCLCKRTYSAINVWQKYLFLIFNFIYEPGEVQLSHTFNGSITAVNFTYK